ncbi:MAG: hypothetical protein ABFD16_26445, partial [Thermoguttaceae bacterium]
MRRLLVVSLTVAAVGALGVQDALAQSPWAAYPIKEGWSGPGFYLNLGKILACWLLFLCWVYTTDWVSRDVQEVKLGFQRWNPIVFGTFLAAF